MSKEIPNLLTSLGLPISGFHNMHFLNIVLVSSTELPFQLVSFYCSTIRPSVLSNTISVDSSLHGNFNLCENRESC